LPPLDETGLWSVQARAIRNLERSLAKADPRALVQMATGSGKTFAAVNAAYRLLKYGGISRILFLVDRANLGKQAMLGFPSLPDGWCWTSVEQCTTLITDGEHITPQRSTSGVLFLSARNVLNGQLSVDDVDFISPAEYERISKRLVIVPGDVLLSCSGSVGRSAVVPKGIIFTLVRSVAVLRPCGITGNYLSLALRSPQLQQEIHDSSASISSGSKIKA
jgi:hypothetical protein